MSAIARIEITHHQLPLDPPFLPSWDPAPRTKFPATIVRVYDDAGRCGIGSGDSMYGFGDYARYFIGENPLDVGRLHAMLMNIEFHAGRPWPVDVALWDLAGKIRGEPIWRMLGGNGAPIRAYASTGVHRPVAEMVNVARRAIDRGYGALKVRFGRASIDDDIAVVRAIRDAVGGALELMVDCNQGWRMPWDAAEPWPLDQAIAVAERLAAERVYWMEEPLHRGDYDGYAALRRTADIRIAGGEMTREPYEFRELLRRECLDVFQPDCVCSGGITGLAALSRDVRAAGKTFTPHTWGNGIGLMANMQLVAGTIAEGAGATWIEYPWDPPEWTASRRDYMLASTIEPDGDGMLYLPDAPGLGIELDEVMLARTASAQATFT